MAFLYPAFLVGALAMAIPIALHLLRRDIAPEVPFTAVRLLRRSPVERSRRRRLRDVLLLAARIAALLLLAAAFARPYAQGAGGDGLRVVAIDRSYSMSAPDRFERALDLARGAIDAAGLAERVAVIGFDERAIVLAEPGGASQARAALAGLTAGSNATRYAPVVEKALDLAEGRPLRLVLVTDMQRNGWDDAQPVNVPADWTIEVRDVGELADNLAVIAVRLEAAGAVASIGNTGASARESTVLVSAGDREIASAALSVPAGDTVDVPLSFRPPDSGALAVTVDDPQGLIADNARYVLVGAPARAKVLILTAGGGAQSGFYLARALETGGDEEPGFHVDVVPGAGLSTMAADRLETYGAVILLSTRGVDRRGRDALAAFVRRGGGLLAAAAPDLEASVLSSVFEWDPPLAPVEQQDVLTLAATDIRHPILRPFAALSANLGQVRVLRAWRLRADGWNVAAHFTDGTPALLERREGNGRVLLFASDLDRRWNDFPLHPAFVPFATEAVRYSARAVEWAREYTPAQAPRGIGPEPGLYQAEPDQRTVAVNVDVRESTSSRMDLEEFTAMLSRSTAGPIRAADLQAEQTEARQSYWRYGLLLMLIALVAESFVGRR